jgi:hydrogenase expression/formation protein HypE
MEKPTFDLSCPVPLQDYPHVLLAHGSGGKLTLSLIENLILPMFRNPSLEPLHDGAILDINGTRVAFTTDAYVVDPIFFPGGDIGELAVNGTVNDLAMCGARPLYLSVSFIIEEGFAMEELVRVVASIQRAAQAAGVLVATGDTKVVDRGKGDKIFITTAGIGIVGQDVNIAPANACVGDRIILSGPIALHGIAIMSVREGLEFESKIESDTAALHSLVEVMLKASVNIHVLRDPTRGGVASALNEIARSAKVGITIMEESIPVPDQVRGACEMLGLDPLYVANEGKLLAFVPQSDATNVLNAMRAHPLGADAVIIGEVVAKDPGLVVMKTAIGGNRIVDMLTGEQLPRIC